MFVHLLSLETDGGCKWDESISSPPPAMAAAATDIQKHCSCLVAKVCFCAAIHADEEQKCKSNSGW